MKKAFTLGLLLLIGISGKLSAQFVYDHEGNEYEYKKMADGRNWMVESMRVTTDREGKPLHLYWVNSSDPLSEGWGYATQEEAGYNVGFAYLREEFLGSPGQSAVRTYSARTQGLCPDGWHVPEYDSGDPPSTTTDLNGFISAYGGKLTWFDMDAEWDSWKSAFRLVPDGYAYAKFFVDPTNQQAYRILGGQLHLMTSGHNGNVHVAILLNVSAGTDKWGGLEEATDAAAYCRCVENIHSTVTFSNFSTFGVDLNFSEALQKNYLFAESVDGKRVDDICPQNFLIKEYGSGKIIPVDNIYKSADYKNVMIEAEFDESKIYELIMVDPKLRDNEVPYGGYTFNEGKKMYFPKSPSAGINGPSSIGEMDIKVYTKDHNLHIEQYETVLNAEILNMQGVKLVSKGNLNGRSLINITNLSSGLYVVRLTDSHTNQVISRKFIVN